MATIIIKDDEFKAGLTRLSRTLDTLDPVLRDMGEYLIQATKERFPEGVSPDGRAWMPKSQATVEAYRSREAKSRNASIDFRPLFGPSGRLSNEIQYQVGPASVEWGSNLIYAAVQQFGASKGAFGTARNGTSIPWGTIPARPFIGVSDEDETALVDLIEDWLQLAAGSS